MSQVTKYIEIKGRKIPVIVRNYKNTAKISIFFRADTLNISKPKYYSLKKVIEKFENEIITNYDKRKSSNEEIMYKGKKYRLQINLNKEIKRIIIKKDDEKEEIKIETPILEKEIIKKSIKKLYKEETKKILEERLEYWKNIMKLEYINVKVNDTVSKYGSCMPKTKKLFFTLRLAMMPQRIYDMIIVHELAHLKYPNHSKEYYAYIEKYMPDYKERDKWLKLNSHLFELVL